MAVRIRGAGRGLSRNGINVRRGHPGISAVGGAHLVQRRSNRDWLTDPLTCTLIGDGRGNTTCGARSGLSARSGLCRRVHLGPQPHINRSSTSPSSDGSIGLSRWAWKPTSSERARSAVPPYPVKAIRRTPEPAILRSSLATA